MALYSTSKLSCKDLRVGGYAERASWSYVFKNWRIWHARIGLLFILNTYLWSFIKKKTWEDSLSQWPTSCTNFNTFITILYMYMFRAISCSSSGGQIVFIQHLVSSLSVSDRPVHTTERSLTDSDDTRCSINPLNAELNPTCHLLTLLVHHFLHVSRIRVNTASGIVTLSKWSSGAQVEKELFLNLCTGQPITDSDDTRCCINLLKPKIFFTYHQV